MLFNADRFWQQPRRLQGTQQPWANTIPGIFAPVLSCLFEGLSTEILSQVFAGANQAPPSRSHTRPGISVRLIDPISRTEGCQYVDEAYRRKHLRFQRRWKLKCNESRKTGNRGTLQNQGLVVGKRRQISFPSKKRPNEEREPPPKPATRFKSR